VRGARLLRPIRGIAAAGLVSACSTVCGIDARGTVEIVAAADANGASATAVDVVVARDETVAATLAGLSASTYFATRDQILRDNPKAMDVTGWEIAPGQSVGPDSVGFPCGVDAIFVYASYAAPGQHRAQLPDLNGVKVSLGASDFSVAQ
jgi:type VI secretion system protein